MNRMRRSAWLAMAAWGAFNALGCNAQAESLPQRNLLVEWRMNGSSAQQNQGGGLRSGEVTVDSRSGVMGRGNVVITSTTRTTTSTGLQQLQVLNGGQARLYLGNSRPVSQWQFGLSGSGLVAPGNSPGSQNWQAWQSNTVVGPGRGLPGAPALVGWAHGPGRAGGPGGPADALRARRPDGIVRGDDHGAGAAGRVGGGGPAGWPDAATPARGAVHRGCQPGRQRGAGDADLRALICPQQWRSCICR